MACRLDGARHYLNQCWNIVNWALRSKLQWNFNRNCIFSFTKMRLKVSSAKWRPFCLGLNVLTIASLASILCTSWHLLLSMLCLYMWPGVRFENTYELLNQRALKFSYVNKIHIFQCMGKIFCVEFQRYPLKFHTKYLTHTLKDMLFMQFWNFKSS